MAIKVRDAWKCGYCGKKFKTSGEADKCKEEHNLIYVPFSAEDLNRLHNFIHLREEKLLTPSLMNTLNKYLKHVRFLDISGKL